MYFTSDNVFKTKVSRRSQQMFLLLILPTPSATVLVGIKNVILKPQETSSLVFILVYTFFLLR